MRIGAPDDETLYEDYCLNSIELHSSSLKVLMKTYIALTFLLVAAITGYSFGDCISGNCVNGQGTFTYSNGDKYTGQFKKGNKHGTGTLDFAAGHTYIGEFKDDIMHGQGTITYSDGEKYVGQWKEGKLHGEGTYTWPNGDNYVGKFKDGRKSGKGTLTFANGSKYIGQWGDGKMHGIGTLYNSDGSIANKGYWKYNSYVGSYTEYIKDRLSSFSGIGGLSSGGSMPAPSK